MIILLTGKRGSGKSTVALNLARQLSQAGIQVGGVICPGIFDQGRKTGIKSHFPNNGHEEIVGEEFLGKKGSMAGKPFPEPTGVDTFSYGRWEFRRSALAVADTAIIAAIEASLFVFVDEIGPLELDHGIGMSRTLARLDVDTSSNNCTIVVCARQDLSQHLTERWPRSKLVELTEEDPLAIGRSANAILIAAGIQLEAGNELEAGKALDTVFSTAGDTQA